MSFNVPLVNFSGLNGWDLLILQISDTVDWSACPALTWFHWPCHPHSLSSSLSDSRGRSAAGRSRPLRPQWRRRSLQRWRLTGRNAGWNHYDSWPNMLINMWGISRMGDGAHAIQSLLLLRNISTWFTFIEWRWAYIGFLDCNYQKMCDDCVISSQVIMSKLMVQVSDAAELLAVHTYFPDMLLLRLLSFREPVFSSGERHSGQTQCQSARRDRATIGRVPVPSMKRLRDGSELQHLLPKVAIVQNTSIRLCLDSGSECLLTSLT